METVPTIAIETENGPVLINLSDFNPDVHKLAGSTESQVSFDRAEAIAYLTEKGVEFAKNIGNTKLAALVEETKAKVTAEEEEATEAPQV